VIEEMTITIVEEMTTTIVEETMMTEIEDIEMMIVIEEMIMNEMMKEDLMY